MHKLIGDTLTFVDLVFNYSGSRGGAVAKKKQPVYRLHERIGVSHPQSFIISMDGPNTNINERMLLMMLMNDCRGWWDVTSKSIINMASPSAMMK